jgi:hypothetical protein
MSNMVTIRQAVSRLKADGLPLTEYSLRILVKRGAVPVRFIGQKALLYYPNIISYLRCEDGGDNVPSTEVHGGIRRVGM